ncbi:MAG: LapA family protein [Terrimicrobiaceae bacterium]|nr:LapA family protein [Terrimicrobiaceae bacterium]
MITIELPWLVFVCLSVFLAGVLLAWLFSEAVRRQRARSEMRFRIQCPLCGLQYEDRSGEPLARCRRCGSLNERNIPRIF